MQSFIKIQYLAKDKEINVEEINAEKYTGKAFRHFNHQYFKVYVPFKVRELDLLGPLKVSLWLFNFVIPASFSQSGQRCS